MSYKNHTAQLSLSDRIAIETGLSSKQSFKKIARTIGKHPSTVAREVKQNRTFIEGNYPFGNDCKNARQCAERNLCRKGKTLCNLRCKYCKCFDCREVCGRYISTACHKYESVPYVCNCCPDKKLCSKDRYIYSAKYAEAAVTRRRSESRQGIRISDAQKAELNELLNRLVKKGQPLTHIYAEHEKEMPVSLRTLYNYIDAGVFDVRNIDLRRKTGYRPRKRKHSDTDNGNDNLNLKEYRQCRTYHDFEFATNVQFTQDQIVEMDTLKGCREQGKRLLTMIFRKNHVMLLFLMPDGKAESVKRVFDYLETGLGLEVFRRLFPVILTDNGSEFKKVDELELTEDLEYRTCIYYCDPMASWQKGCLEKNHEYIRYALPSGTSFNPYKQEDMTLLMNHINSVKRPALGNKSPYDLIYEGDKDFAALVELLKMHPIPPDEVHLTPDLFVRK